MSYEIPNQHKDPAVQAIVDSLEDNKAENVTVIPLKGKAEFAEFMGLIGSRSKCLEDIPAVIEVNKDQTEIVVFPDTPLPSDGDYSLHIKLFNPQGNRMYQFNALVQAPGDVPMSGYRGIWLIDLD